MDQDLDFGRYIRRLDRFMRADAERSIAAQGLTLPQSHLLLSLLHREGHSATLKELESIVHGSQSTVAGIVVRLTAKGCLESWISPADRRVKHVRLTADGMRRAEACLKDLRQSSARISSPLTAEELHMFSGMLRRLCEACETRRDTDGMPMKG